MGVIIHEAVGINLYLIAIFIPKEEGSIEPFSPGVFKEPIVVMTLPGHMKGGTVFDNGVTRE